MRNFARNAYGRLAIVVILALGLTLAACSSGNTSRACAATLTDLSDASFDSSSYVVLARGGGSSGGGVHVSSGGVSGKAAPAAPRPAPAAPKPPVGQNKTTNGTNTGNTGGVSGKAASNNGSANKSVPQPPSSGVKHTVPGEKAYTPPKNVKQPQADITTSQSTLKSGTTLSNSPNHGYASPVTHHWYYYHPASYFMGLGWHDPYDPYDPFNWTNPFSPWNNYHFLFAANAASYGYLGSSC